MAMLRVPHQKAHNRSINARRPPQNKTNSGHLKSQSAMEYLLTYGWAILIIVSVLVAMFSLGVFNATEPTVQPGACNVYKSVEGASNIGECQGVWPEFVSYFNGQNAYVNIPMSSSLASTPTITVLAWVDFSKVPVEAYEFIDNAGGGGGFVFYAYVASPTPSIMGSVLIGGSQYYPQGASPISYNTWHQVGFEYDGGHIYNIVDGKFAASAPLTGSISETTSTTLRIDGRPLQQGNVANVQIYDTPLSANEISALYQEGIGGAPIDPYDIIGWWPLNGNAQDYSGSNDNGQAVNVAYNSTWESAYTQP